MKQETLAWTLGSKLGIGAGLVPDDHPGLSDLGF
jgi:hypothetical protein